MAIIKDSLHNQVYTVIRQKILDQELKQGELILTKKIAEEHGISVMPVRNALQKLTDYGLVIKKERVGYFVKDFSKKEIAEINDVRKMYEVHCLDEYFDFLDFGRIKEIHEIFKAKNKISLLEYRKMDVELHNLFVSASHNEFLIKQYDRVKDLFWLFMFIDKNMKDNTRDISEKEHIHILEAILANKKEEAIQILKIHLDRVSNEAIKLLQKS